MSKTHVVVLPIEPLEERYSIQWLDWTIRFFEGIKDLRTDFDYTIILPKSSSYKTIKNGQFLDAIHTNRFKADQLSMTIEWISRNEDIIVNDNVVFWIHDGWFPGVEMLAYIRNSMNYCYKIFACMHAGTWDTNDFLSQCGMGSWAYDLEKSWFSLYDGVFVATEYHRNLILNEKRSLTGEGIYTTGFPFYPTEKNPLIHTLDRDNIVVFPHRLADEKQPDLFRQMKNKAEGLESLSRFKFLFTKEECSNKKEYYDLLSRAKYSVSFALQETWGIAMQESVIAGCIPIVPDRLSYPEMYQPAFVYPNCGDLQYATNLIVALEQVNPDKIMDALSESQRFLITAGERALNNMLNVMEGKASYYDSMYYYPY